MLRGRRIAFDYGDVRIGVAVSDPDSILCSPLTTLKATDKNLDSQLSQIIVEHEPVQIFVGRPALLSGADGTASEKARLFADRLRAIPTKNNRFIYVFLNLGRTPKSRPRQPYQYCFWSLLQSYLNLANFERR